MKPELEQRIEALQKRIEELYNARAYEQDDPGGRNKRANDAEELAILKERDAIQQEIIDSGEMDIPAQEIKTINIDSVPENSVLLIKINAEHGMQQRVAATQQIARALQPLNDKIKAKKIVLIVMATDEDMSDLEEAEMNKMGWYRKEPSLIINPYTNRPAS